MPKKPAKMRADRLLVARGLAPDPARAAAFIMEGHVFSAGRRVAKPGDLLRADADLELRQKKHPWVSRGGVKLAHALAFFAIDPTGFEALDIGASTGGFTDVLLQKGAAHVTAVDVGTNQLAWKLRSDPRVTALEQTHARALTATMLPRPPDIIVCDASFIRLSHVLDVPLSLARSGCWLVALVKPQFEAAHAEIEEGGVVRDPAVRTRIVANCEGWVAGQGWRVVGVTPSPITGPKGNVEFLLAACKI